MDDMLDDGEKHTRKMDSLGAILSIMIKGISFFKSGFFFFWWGLLRYRRRERERILCTLAEARSQELHGS